MILVDTFRGDFLGFTLGGLHSTEFNIVRVTGGNRMELSLLPPTKNNIVSIPGADGAYYIDEEINSNKISFKIAYDDLREEQIQAMRTWLGNEEEQDLILDECPFKAYRVKVSSQPKLNFIPFDSPDKDYRIYKGEGTLQFEMFYPFARAIHKELRLYPDSEYPTKHQWAPASKIKLSLLDTPQYDIFPSGSNRCKLYNAGDRSTPLIIPYISALNNTGYQAFTLTYNNENITRMVLDMSKMPTNEYVRLDSKTQLLIGIDKVTLKPTKNIYNRAIIAGDFFEIKAYNSSIKKN